LIPKKAVDAFLARPRADYRKWLDLTDAQIREKYLALPIEPPIWKTLHRKQKICFLLGAEKRAFGFWNDMGTGKTLLAIALIAYFRALGEIDRALVLVPYRIVKDEWERELKKHAPQYRYVVLRGSTAQKWEALRAMKREAFIVETYMGAVRLLSNSQKIKRKGKSKRMERLIPDKKRIKELAGMIGGLVLDESVAVSNRAKLPYRLVKQLAKSCPVRFPMCGTPFGRDPTLLWAQMYLIDWGNTLGETLGLFRKALFKESDTFWGGVEYKFDKKKAPLLNRLIADRSITVSADAADLPPVVAISKYVILPSDANAYYQKAKQAIIAAHGNYQETKNAFLRMRQISSGFLGYYDDEEGARAQFEFPDNPKMDQLQALLDFIPDGEKCLVMHDFIYSGGMIEQMLNRHSIGYVRLSHKTKEPAKLLSAFDKDPKVRVFVLSTAGAYGLNLQTARYGIYYESPVSVIIRKQMDRRWERQGSKHSSVFRYDLIVQGTVDESILAFHKQGKDLFKAIMRNPRTLI
jgi:SNF2 family DNA or RNA helicase